MVKIDARAGEKKDDHDACPMRDFITVIAGKWALPVLYRLIVINGPVRFSELLRAVSPVTQKELTRQLRLFEHRGLVDRRVYAEVPPRVEYQITPLGLTLGGALGALADWMREYGSALKR